jgi:hydroxymethylglutaryl-CoA reductase (NADPH)
MLGYLTSRWQSTGEPKKTSPTWFDRHFSPILLSISKKACTHPIHTIVTIAFLASFSYIGVLDKGLLESGSEETTSRVDFHSLLAGSKRLRIGEETEWHWEADEERKAVFKDKVHHHPVDTRRPGASLIHHRRYRNSLS